MPTRADRNASSPPDLIVRIRKGENGAAVLQCERADGSVTWQKPKPAHGHFFALHDLTHYAVETTLGARRGFYGLLCEGWDISDFGAPYPHGPIPPEAGWVERIVGFLDSERAAGLLWAADDFNDKARLYYADHGGAPQRDLTDDELNAVRDRRRALFSEWSRVPNGSTLELPFNRK